MVFPTKSDIIYTFSTWYIYQTSSYIRRTFVITIKTIDLICLYYYFCYFCLCTWMNRQIFKWMKHLCKIVTQFYRPTKWNHESWGKNLLHFFIHVERSSPSKVFFQKGVLEICNKFTGEQSCGSVISINLQSNFIEITLHTSAWVFSCAFVPYFQNTLL